MRQTFITIVAGGLGRWVTSDQYDASRRLLPDGSLDPETVAGIVDEIEARGGLLESPHLAVQPERRARGLWVKHAFDRDVAALLLVLLSPLLLLVALLVWASSPGPVLFRQQRVGLGGKGFVIWKFRSMRQASAMPRFEPTAGLAPGGIEGDDRRTPIGRVIRALSIDELPQLINVLRGEMSLVGPRPERPRFVERFSRELPGYASRHRVRPGITGLAQVNGCRGATSIARRLELDVEYINSWSLWLDMKILALTGATVVGMAREVDKPGTTSLPETMLIGRREPVHANRRREAADGGSMQVTPQSQAAGSSIDS